MPGSAGKASQPLIRTLIGSLAPPVEEEDGDQFNQEVTLLDI